VHESGKTLAATHYSRYPPQSQLTAVSVSLTPHGVSTKTNGRLRTAAHGQRNPSTLAPHAQECTVCSRWDSIELPPRHDHSTVHRPQTHMLRCAPRSPQSRPSHVHIGRHIPSPRRLERHAWRSRLALCRDDQRPSHPLFRSPLTSVRRYTHTHHRTLVPA